MIVFIVVILAMIGVFSLRLYKTQAAVTEDSLVAADADSMEYQSTVEAARGNILDRNGNVLVSNRASYNLVIINFVFFNAPDPNGNLLKVLNLCDELGIAYESHFPVSAERPYTYTDTDDTAWQGYFRSFLASRSYDLDISAPTLMKRLRDEYKIPDDWTQQDVYRVISVRYELELRSVDEIGMENYMLAEDVDAESLAAVMELAVPGVVVENGTVREYNTTYAAHILGYIGPIWSEEAAEYREKGYSMNALVGKSGVEQAFEEYLHGSSGIKRTTVSSTGEILNRYYVTEPVPGNNVELTIDISLQAVAEQALEKVILDLRENGVGRNKEGKDAQEILSDGLMRGMTQLGEDFSANRAFVPEMLLAARCMAAATELLKPYLTAGGTETIGRVCLGTVRGDMHDIGKNLVKIMFEGSGLEVVDLGVDVAPERFIDAAKAQQCGIIACSSLLTTTMQEMRRVVELAEEAGIRGSVKIMVGGAPISQSFCDEIGADVYTEDAAAAARAAVALCR